MNLKTTLLCILVTLFSIVSFSQEVVCEGSPCTSNDFTIDYFYLGDENGVPFGPGYCEPGNTVEAHLWINFTANAAAPRYSQYLHFNLYLDGEFIVTIDECFYDGQPIPTSVTLDTHTFSWECGAEVVLGDLYMSWQTNDNGSCDCAQSHCYIEESVVVLAPLIANFSFGPSCLTAYTVDFMSTTTGGVPPYTFYWEFGDGTTSTEENPSHTYASTGPYTVSLTVQDTENTDSYEFEIVSFNPNLPPEITAPTNSAIEGCDVTAISPFIYSETAVEITEADFVNLGGTLVVSNDIVSLSYFDTSTGSCPLIITRTFTIIDSCDNTNSAIQTITITDTTPPTASNPSDINIQCVSDIPLFDINVVTDAADNCSNTIVSFISDVSDNQICPETITRTYSVTDECGNTINVTQNIIVLDDVVPTASNPSPLTVQCIADVPSPDINVVTDEADNCSVPTVAFVSDISDGQSCPETITRTYSITDDCGNTANVFQNIIIGDDIVPTASNPTTITVQCIGDVPSPDINVVIDEADNCSTPTVAFVSDVSDNQTCPEIITRTYRITDDCGNSINVTQSIIVNDDIPPTASNLATINLQCITDIPAPDVNLITDAVDNCSSPIVTFISDSSDYDLCPETVIRTYQVSDDCGNSINVTQTFIIYDDISPTASNPADITLACGTEIPSPDINLVIDEADNCSVPAVIFVSDVSNGACPEVITRTFEIRDQCGNSINVTQDIIFVDTTGPVLVNALDEDITVNCLSVPDAPVLEFEDDCSLNITISFSETSTNDNNTVDYEIIRTWIATDECGNQSVFVQNIQVLIADCIVSTCNSCGPVDDTIAPTASNPADITVSCTGSIPDPDVNVVTDEADNCAPPTVTFISETISVDCFERIRRTYRVTDECGNYIDVSHNITVIDDVLPTASNPPELIVSCVDEVPIPDINVVTDEADNCSIPVVAFVSDISNNFCDDRITRTYSVTDGCGNSINVVQIITVVDDISPTASNPPDVTLACISDLPSPDTSIITDEADNCAVPTVAFVSDVSDNQNCPETILRTYSVTDPCGNSINVTQTFIINDDIFPTASNPPAVSLQCISDIPSPNINVVTDESDNCSTPIVTYISDISDNQSCPETITRTYSVTDACNNSINVTQTFIINDDILPTASDLSTINLQCIADLPSPDINVVNDEADNCAVPTVAFVSDVTDNQSCPETITRTYSVTDSCNNSINVNQTFIIHDDIPPTATNPETITVQCVDDVLPADISVVTDASDNCGPPIVAFVSEVSNNQNCQETILRTFSVTDNCGNSVNVVQTIIVEDDIAPTASNPPTINVQCLEDVPIPDINVIADANDNCSIPVVAFVSDVSEIGICSENITRTYSITDDCNNTINVTQLIIVYDNVEPVLVTDIEGIIDITCEEVPTEPLVEFSDNCTTNVDVVFNEYINEFDDFSYDIIREWIATDYCNNSITTNQVVRVRKFNNTAKHDLVFCIEDETFDINSLLDFGGDTNSGWESDSMNLLEDGILNPADTPLGNYQFVHTYNQNGCIQTTNATIGIHDDCVEFTCIESEAYVDIPKIVTPNNDGFNDVFEILYTIDERSDDSCDIVLDVKIFNRWGTRVYQSGNYQNDWSGNSPSSGMGGSDYLPTGTYFYIVELKSSGLKPIQGYIYLGTN